MAFALWVQATGAELAAAVWWELVKGVLLFSITGLLAIIARSAIGVRDDVRDLKRDLPAIKSEVADVIERLDVIEKRDLVIDAVAEIERDQYQGDERRHGVRAVRDMIRAEIASLQPRTP